MEPATPLKTTSAPIFSQVSGHHTRALERSAKEERLEPLRNTESSIVYLSPESIKISKTGSTEEDEQRVPVQNLQAEYAILTDAEVKQLRALKSRDTEVRTHEQAHMSAGAQHIAGSPTFTYQTGPDGKRYVIGGEVPIDISKEATPEETIAKMETVKRAALAPAEPSAADRQIASQASMKLAQAREELALQQRQEEQTKQTENDSAETESGEVSVTEPQDRAATGVSVSFMINAYTANIS